jgi:hypothetical protein
MSKGYFWLKFAKPGAIIGEAPAATAQVKTGKAPGQGKSASGGQVIEGYTIRPSFKVGEKQATATITFIPETGTTMMPCALYTVEDAAKVTTPYCAKKQGEAAAERANQRFKDWAADGVPVLIEIDLTQTGPDEA